MAGTGQELGRGDTAATGELLALLDARPPGHLAPMLRAERDLARARLDAGDGPDAAEALVAAVSGLRELSTPYHLAHGLLDDASYLARLGDPDAAALAIDEARAIGQRLLPAPARPGHRMTPSISGAQTLGHRLGEEPGSPNPISSRSAHLRQPLRPARFIGTFAPDLYIQYVRDLAGSPSMTTGSSTPPASARPWPDTPVK